MSDFIIKVENLGKKYRIQHQGERERYLALRDVIANGVKGLGASVFSGIRSWVPGLGSSAGNGHQSRNGTLPENLAPNTQSPKPNTEDFWALKDVSFEVKQGEVLGIIGRNGAGKSTLLKILSRITEPTEGRVRLRGRLASLLEVGTGFHPELTGRENIFLNGAILGMTREEIRRKFDEIVAFAEVEKFIDTPVKRYSSGMYVRLAFAVAAHLESEILLVDEVLAVGDVAFQRKCLGKMGDVARTGRTVLFVSHSMNVVAQLCQEAVVLHQGQVVLKAPATKAIAEYLADKKGERGQKRWVTEDLRGRNGIFRPIALTIRDQEGKITDQLTNSEPFWIEIDYEVTEAERDLRVGIILSGGDGVLLFISFDADDPAQYAQRRPAGKYRSQCRIPEHWVNEGCFIVGINAGIFNVGRLFQDEHALMFNVTKTGGAGSHWAEASGGYLRPSLEWRIECLEQYVR